MPTENPYAIDILTSRTIEALWRRRYAAPLRYGLQELPHTPLLDRPRRAVRRAR